MLLLTGFYIIGVAMIVIAAYLCFWRNKRRFNRRNWVGLEEYKSYEHSLKTRYSESIVRLLYSILFIAGMLILLYAIFEGKYIMRIDHW